MPGLLKRFVLLCLLCVCTLLGSMSLVAQAPSDTTTTVTGAVFDAQTGVPIPNARITVSGYAALTDSTGQFSVSGLNVSGDYQLVTITVEAAGYGLWQMTDTAIYPGVTRILANIRLTTAAQTVYGGGLPRPLNDAYADDVPQQLFDLRPPEMLEPFFFSHDTIPTTIRVGVTGFLHCSDWLAAGQPVERVEEMLFQDYVKNVLGNEWVSTWDAESLKAGAVAVKMFAWWRINLDADGIRPSGAHVVDNTCDQVFIMNSEQSTTSAAVDATWTDIMREDGRVVEIHYLNTDSNCARYFPGIRCMGQWGSKALADEGRDWRYILHYYYDPVEITLGDSTLPLVEAHTDLIFNGDFSEGVRGWGLFGDAEWAVSGGVLSFKRVADDIGRGGVVQSLPYRFEPGMMVEIALELGNSSAVTKTPRVYLRDAYNTGDAFQCDFVLPPNTPLQTYVIRGNTGVWISPRLEIWPDPADSLPDVQLDNVRVTRQANLPIVGTQCLQPEAVTNWNFSGGPGGWSAWEGWQNPRVEVLGTRYTLSSETDLLASPTLTSINATDYEQVLVQLATDVSTCGAVYFGREGERAPSDERRVTFDIVPSEVSQTYSVNMAVNSNWTGQITRLWLDADCDNAGGSVLLSQVVIIGGGGTPLLQAPSGQITTGYGNPTYQWDAVSGATDYQLYVGTQGGEMVAYVRLPAVDYCTGAVCSVELTALDEAYRLENAAYVVYLRAWARNEPGSWVGPFSFTLNAEAPAPVGLNPPANTDTPRPTLQWSLPGTAAYATEFRVYLMDASGSVRLDRTFNRMAACGMADSTTCVLPSPVDLENGLYTLYVLSSGPGGGSTSVFAGPQTITVDGASGTLPTNLQVTLENGQPVLTWDDTLSATWYQVHIGRDDGFVLDYNWHQPDACDGTLCRLTVDVYPPNGAYEVYIQTWSAGGLSAWGGPIGFAVNAPVTTVPVPLPVENASLGRPTFRWNASAGATWYRLQITQGDTTQYDQWHAIGGLACGETCAFTPQIDLSNGSYSWLLQAWGPGGLSEETPQQGLNVISSTPPAPLPLTPTGNVYLPQPNFQWRQVPDGAWYEIEMTTDTEPAIVIERGWYSVADLVCLDDLLCTWVADFLPPSDYRWRVRAYSPAGVGDWSAWQRFRMVY